MSRTPFVLVLAAVAPLQAVALSTAQWTIDQTVPRGQTEAFYQSPTRVDIGIGPYDWSYNVSRVEALVPGGSLDVTGLVGASFPLSQSGQAAALPILAVDQPISDPITATSGRVLLRIDDLGFGRASLTNVMLGTLSISGNMIDIQGLRVLATMSVTGLNPFPIGDYNRSGGVTTADLQTWTQSYAGSGAAALSADGNGDGSIDAADYTVWRDAYRPMRSEATAVPEPASGVAAVVAGAAALCVLRRAR